METKIQARKVPPKYYYKWMLGAWAVAKKHYGPCLGIGLFYVAASIGSSFLGLTGKFVMIGLGPILFAGCILVTATWLKGESAGFADFFQVFKDNEKLRRALPYVAANFVVTLPFLLVTPPKPGEPMGLYFLCASIPSIFSLISWMVLPLLLIKKMDYLAALQTSLDAMITNFASVILTMLAAMVVGIVATLLLAIPLTFVVLPSVVTLSYIMYATIFEDLDIETLIAKK